MLWPRLMMGKHPIQKTMNLDPKQFRQALGRFATGITIVTTRDAQGVDVGVTANSFNSVSLDPPMILWSLAKSSYSLPAFEAAEHFAVHVLAAEQENLSNRFASRGIDKFADINLNRGRDGIPLLQDYAARFECRTAFRYEGGDHLIIVGEVLDYDHSQRAPLLYHDGRYAVALPVKPAIPSSLITDEPDSSFSQDFLIYLLSRAHHHLFMEARRELERFAVNEEGWFILSLLGLADHRPLTELNRLLSYTGKNVTYELVASLSAAGLVTLNGRYDPEARASLTAVGHQAVVELVAAGKACEEYAMRNFSNTEQHLFKLALRQLIRDTPVASTNWILSPDRHD